MEFLTVSDVILIHALQIREFGGLLNIRDRGLLEGAVHAPIFQHYYEPHATPYDLAATYAYCISRDQAFFDGNKRTGLHCALIFLDLNGITVHTPTRVLLQMTEELSTNERNRKTFAAYLAAPIV